MDTIPVEILDLIIFYLSDDKKSLINLAATSQFMWNIACCVLYSDITCDNWAYYSVDHMHRGTRQLSRKPTTNKDRLMIRTLARNTILASFVRKIRSDPDRDDEALIMALDEGTCSLAKAAAGMVNLEVAHLQAHIIAKKIFEHMHRYKHLRELRISTEDPRCFIWRPDLCLDQLVDINWTINPETYGLVEKCWTVVAVLEMTCPKLRKLIITLPKDWQSYGVDDNVWPQDNVYNLLDSQCHHSIEQWIKEQHETPAKIALEEFGIDQSYSPLYLTRSRTVFPWAAFRKQFVEVVWQRYSKSLLRLSADIGDNLKNQEDQISSLAAYLPGMPRLKSLSIHGAGNIWAHLSKDVVSKPLQLVKMFTNDFSPLCSLGQRLTEMSIRTTGRPLNAKLGQIFQGLVHLTMLSVETDEDTRTDERFNFEQTIVKFHYENFLEFITYLPRKLQSLRVSLYCHSVDGYHVSDFTKLYKTLGVDVISIFPALNACDFLHNAQSKFGTMSLRHAFYARRLAYYNPIRSLKESSLNIRTIQTTFCDWFDHEIKARKFEKLSLQRKTNVLPAFHGANAEPWWFEYDGDIQKTFDGKGQEIFPQFTKDNFEELEWPFKDNLGVA